VFRLIDHLDSRGKKETKMKISLNNQIVLLQIMLLFVVVTGLYNLSLAQEKSKVNAGVPTSQKAQENLKSWLNTPRSRFQNLSAIVEYDKVQHAAKGGIEFSIVITNQNEHDVEFINPLDFNLIRLSNEKSKNLRLPCWESRLGRERWSRKKPLEFDLPFQLISVSVDDRALTGQEIEKRTFNIPAGRVMRLSIKLEKAEKLLNAEPVAKASSNICAPPDAVASLSAGKYKLQICINFMAWKEIDVQSIFCSEDMDIELKEKVE
jgi:hypothetical protein